MINFGDEMRTKLIAFIFILISCLSAEDMVIQIDLEHIQFQTGQQVYFIGDAEPQLMTIDESNQIGQITVTHPDSNIGKWTDAGFEVWENGTVVLTERKRHQFLIPDQPDTLTFNFDFQTTSFLGTPVSWQVSVDMKGKTFGEGILEDVKVSGPWGELLLTDSNADSVWSGDVTLSENMYPSIKFRLQYKVSGDWQNEYILNSAYHYAVFNTDNLYPELTLRFDKDSYVYTVKSASGMTVDDPGSLTDELYKEDMQFKQIVGLINDGRLDEAENSFNQNIVNKPAFEQFYLRKITWYQKNGLPDSAKIVLEENKDKEYLTPDQKEWYSLYEGNINLQLDSTETAKQIYNELLTSSNLKIKARSAFMLHRVYLNEEDAQSAIDVLNLVIDSCEINDRLTACENLVSIYQNENDYPKIIETLTRKKGMVAVGRQHLLEQRMALIEILQEKDYDAGINRLETLLSEAVESQKEAAFTYSKGVGYRLKGDTETAVSVFTEIKEKWPDTIEAQKAGKELELLEESGGTE